MGGGCSRDKKEIEKKQRRRGAHSTESLLKSIEKQKATGGGEMERLRGRLKI